MMGFEVIPGFFGKIPACGDFVSRQLPAAFVAAWDDWLQACLIASKQRLGDQWLDYYLNSPIYRFVLSAGCCGDKSAAGVLMPSVDRVGRYYPLTLAASADAHFPVTHLLASAAQWFERLETLALSALEDDFELTRFEHALGVATLVLDEAEKKPGSKVANLFFSTEIDNGTGTACESMAGKLLEQFLPLNSIWSTSGSEIIRPQLMLFKGMPAPGAYAYFLTGGETALSK